MKTGNSASSDTFRSLLLGDRVSQERPGTRVLVKVLDGLHKGAWVRFQRTPLTIGRSLSSDIVLRDSGVASAQAELYFDGARWSILGVGTAEAPLVVDHCIRGPNLRERVDLGHAKLIISQPATAAAMARYDKPQIEKPATAAMVVLTVLSAGLIYASVHQSLNAEMPGIASGLENANLSAWPDVVVTQTDDEAWQLSGFVNTVEDKQRLIAEIKPGRADNLSKLRSGDQIVMQLRHVIASENVKVRYTGAGTVRLAGFIADRTEFDRIKWVKDEYGGLVRFDDVTVFQEPTPKPVRRALPFQIMDVIPGEGGSFSDKDGNRYFVGARLPDGSVVVDVQEGAVVFALDGTRITYPTR